MHFDRRSRARSSERAGDDRRTQRWLRNAVRWFDPARLSLGTNAPAATTPAADVLRIVQIAALGALVAAIAAEITAASIDDRASPLTLLAPPAHALHPFLPVFIGGLVMPAVIGALALVIGFVYRVACGVRVPSTPGARASFAVAVRGMVPLYASVALLPLPAGGGAVVIVGLAWSVLAWAGGYSRVLGVRAGHGAKLLGVGVFAALGVLPMLGALLATLA